MNYVVAAMLTSAAALAAEPDPLQLHFHRVAVRRSIFSNNIPLSELAPAEIVAQEEQLGQKRVQCPA